MNIFWFKKNFFKELIFNAFQLDPKKQIMLHSIYQYSVKASGICLCRKSSVYNIFSYSIYGTRSGLVEAEIYILCSIVQNS